MIDTSVLIPIGRAAVSRWPDLMNALASDGFLSAIEVTELALGIHLANTEARRRERSAFLAYALRTLSLIPFGEAEARETARLQVLLRRQGLPVGDRDLQIAATTMANGHELMTANVRELGQIPGFAIVAPPSA